MARSRKHEIGVGVLLIVATGLLAFMSLKVGALKGLGDTLDVVALVPDAGGLTEGAEVKVAGVPIGKLTGLTVEHDQALLHLTLEEGAGVRADAIVQIRARSVLGEKFVELRPDSADAPLLKDGDKLSRSLPQTEIDQLVNALGPLVAAVDPEALNGALLSLNGALKEDPERLKRMLIDTETILHNAALASAQAPALMDESRGALASVKAAADQARPTLGHADRAIGQLQTATAELPGALQDVRLLVGDARGLVGEARGAVADGSAVLSDVHAQGPKVERIINNLSEIDKVELRRLLREEGILLRLREREVDEEAVHKGPKP